MKIVIASDIHGSSLFLEKLLSFCDQYQPDKLLLLGDLLYHGPRNDLPEGHNPKRALALLNEQRDRIIAVRGNCDAEVDQMVLDFPCMADYEIVPADDVRFFATHGHVVTPEQAHEAIAKQPALQQPAALEAASPEAGSLEFASPDTGPYLTWVFASGHTHVKVLEKDGDIVRLNPGSLSIPKDGTHSFATYENGTITLINLLDLQVLKTLDI